MTIMNYTVLSFCFLFFLVYAMSFVFFFFLLVYVCVHVWTCMIVRECIRISSPGTCDQPNPPKILSNATIFVQPAQHVPCVAHQTSLMAETLKLDFQRQLQQRQLATLVLRLFCSFFMRKMCCKLVWLQEMANGNKRQLSYLPNHLRKLSFVCLISKDTTNRFFF